MFRISVIRSRNFHFGVTFQGAITGALLLGYASCAFPGIAINVMSMELSGFLLTSLSVLALLSICLPPVLMILPHVASIITFLQGTSHMSSYYASMRITANWIPDKENTLLTSIFHAAYLTGRMSVMFISAPIADRVHWSAPSVIFSAIYLCAIALFSTIVSVKSWYE